MLFYFTRGEHGRLGLNAESQQLYCIVCQYARTGIFKISYECSYQICTPIILLLQFSCWGCAQSLRSATSTSLFTLKMPGKVTFAESHLNLKFCQQVLGQRFKTKIPALKKAITTLSRDQIVQFDRTQALEVEGCQLQDGDMRVGRHTSLSVYTFSICANSSFKYCSSDDTLHRGMLHVAVAENLHSWTCVSKFTRSCKIFCQSSCIYTYIQACTEVELESGVVYVLCFFNNLFTFFFHHTAFANICLLTRCPRQENECSSIGRICQAFEIRPPEILIMPRHCNCASLQYNRAETSHIDT